jgi:hypothetical protein
LKPVRQRVKGLGGVLDGLRTGTIEWTIEDDEGMPYVIKLPGSLYVPNSPSRLLSPQHWAQTASGDQPWCETYHNEVRLLWNGGQRKKTAKLSKLTGNVATIYTAPGFQAYHSFMEEAGLKEPVDLVVFNQNLVSDDEASEDEEETRQSSWESMNVEEVELLLKQDRQTSQQYEFNLDGPEGTETVRTPTIIEDEEDSPKLESVAAKLLKKHHCLNHLSMAKMQVMAKQGILPKRWAKCDIPICTSCLYGKATRRPWQTKPKKDSQESKLRTATEPGQCISVDQLESRTSDLNHFQPFGCPVFNLDANMQAGKKLPKWQLRSRTGINLGLSNQHARSIVLVLNLTTCHVSPQFHVKFDPKFQTVRESLGNSAPPSEWQVECGFKSRRRTEGKKLEPSKEGTKGDHLQTQREEVEEQPDIPEEQGMEMKDFTKVEGQAKSGLQGKEFGKTKRGQRGCICDHR